MTIQNDEDLSRAAGLPDPAWSADRLDEYVRETFGRLTDDLLRFAVVFKLAAGRPRHGDWLAMLTHIGQTVADVRYANAPGPGHPVPRATHLTSAVEQHLDALTASDDPQYLASVRANEGLAYHTDLTTAVAGMLLDALGAVQVVAQASPKPETLSPADRAALNELRQRLAGLPPAETERAAG